jgi:branched-chain amino acid transport system substrate-binding protein
LPAFTEPYRRAGSLRSRSQRGGRHQHVKLVVISKDDGGKPADAQTAANELVSRERGDADRHVLSNIGLAVSDFANQKKVFFPAEP